ncbi:glycosyltransferase family 87 protein [Naasia lichenicola]|uniref:glycosyltransferase family 87 protein n=1 Tax=Naasia lichenicola TaxID=2565933 RepID=UPI001E33BD5A|nr:glycosyltransferase family 87 protein [Naasia lichenicola]
MRIALTVLSLGALTVLTAIGVLSFDSFEKAPSGGFFYRSDGLPLMLCAAGGWALFAVALLGLRRVSAKAVPWLVFGGAIAIGLAALAGPPNTSTDSARYAWDGIVQKADVSPYEYVPADTALEGLKPDWLFPAATTAADGTQECVGERIGTIESGPSDGSSDGGDAASATDDVSDSGDVRCTALNRPLVPTIYPPLAELYFLAVRLFVPSEVSYIAFQVAGLLVSLGITAVLLRVLRRSGRPLWWAALWAWCPLVASEAVTNSHVDVLGAGLALIATALVASGRPWRGGIALGLAIAAKLIPVIAAPALLRRSPVKIIGAAIVTFALLYVPYVLTTGLKVIGYLPGYLSEEGYENGTRFVLIPGWVPPMLAAAIVAAVLAVTAGVVLWKTPPSNPWVGQLVMIGVTLIAVSPRYAWYALLLIPFIAMSGRWEWFAVALALTFRLVTPPNAAFATALIVAAVVVAVGSWLRATPEQRARLLRRRPAVPSA